MKTVIKMLYFVFCFSATVAIAQSTNHTEKSFFGKWEAKVNEPVDGKCLIEVEWKSDNTAVIHFKHKTGVVTDLSSKWKYTDPNYEEVYPDGSIGKAKITWIDDNKFKLTIIKNQDTKEYKGRTRIFKRKK